MHATKKDINIRSESRISNNQGVQILMVGKVQYKNC